MSRSASLPLRALRVGAAAGALRAAPRGRRTRPHACSTAASSGTSTRPSRGGGVAEMLVSLLAYAHGAGVDARWTVIAGNDAVLRADQAHPQQPARRRRATAATSARPSAAIYDEALAPNIEEFTALVKPRGRRDRPRPPAGRADPAAQGHGRAGHLALPRRDRHARAISRARAWEFLMPYVEPADAYVFSREAVRVGGPRRRQDRADRPGRSTPSRPRTRSSTRETVAAILAVAGLNEDGAAGTPTFTREDGTPGPRRPPRDSVGGPRCCARTTRWSSRSRAGTALKDPIGVIRGFVEHVAPAHRRAPRLRRARRRGGGRRPRGQGRCSTRRRPYFERCSTRGQGARPPRRAADGRPRAENAAIVNALQRRADVVVQKSIAEGFGLTVAEAMWKARPVVASRIGGIQDQIVDGESGMLLDDPHRPRRLRRGGARPAREPRPGRGDRARGAGARARRLPGRAQPPAVPRPDREAAQVKPRRDMGD